MTAGVDTTALAAKLRAPPPRPYNWALPLASPICDADPAFKQLLARAKTENMVEFVSGNCLPERFVRTPLA